MSRLSWILLLTILLGQIIKIPSGSSGGVTALDITIAILSLVGIYKTRLKFSKLPLFLRSGFIFIGITIISLLLTPLHLTLSQYLLSSLYIIRLGLYFLFATFIYLGVFPKIKTDLEKILIGSGLGLATFGLLQLIFLPDLGFLQTSGWDPHFLRTASTFLDPNFLGAYLTLSLILILSKFHQSRKLTKHTFIPIILYLALLTTFSRSSYLTFLVSGLILGILKKSWHISGLVVILFGGLLVGFQIYTILVSTPRNIDRTYSADARLSTWQQGITIFKNSPLLGSGYNAYRYALTQENLATPAFANERGGTSNDSSLLNVLATTGIVGVIAYLTLLFSLIKLGFSQLKNGGVILISVLGGLLIHSLFNNSLFYSFIMLWIFTLPALCHSREGGNPVK